MRKLVMIAVIFGASTSCSGSEPEAVSDPSEQERAHSPSSDFCLPLAGRPREAASSEELWSLYWHYSGCVGDHASTRTALELLVERRDTKAMRSLALHLRGTDRPAAVALLRRAASAGDERAARTLERWESRSSVSRE